MLKLFQFLIFVFLMLTNIKTFAQKKDDEFSNKIFNFQFMYNAQTPSGDWEKLYGFSNGLGFGCNYKSTTNWLMSMEGNFMLSDNLKNTLNLINLTNSNNYTYNSNTGSPASVYITMRGFSTFAKLGKIFPISKYNKNHGFVIQIGVGYLMHYTNFNIPQSTVAQLNENYQKGYDKLHTGIALNQFVGYYFQSENRLINFYIGLDFTQAFTKNQREFNYDTKQYDTGSKQDNITALRIAWLIPIYLSNKNDEFNFNTN